MVLSIPAKGHGSLHWPRQSRQSLSATASPSLARQMRPTSCRGDRGGSGSGSRNRSSSRDGGRVQGRWTTVYTIHSLPRSPCNHYGGPESLVGDQATLPRPAPVKASPPTTPMWAGGHWNAFSSASDQKETHLREGGPPQATDGRDSSLLRSVSNALDPAWTTLAQSPPGNPSGLAWSNARCKLDKN